MSVLEIEVALALEKRTEAVPKIRNPQENETRRFSLLCVFINTVLAVCKVFFGAIYLNDCPTNHYMPIYCLVGGLLQLACIATLCFKPLQDIRLQSIFIITYFLWFLIASIQTLIEFQPDYFKHGWRYCNRHFFYFAFGTSLTEVTIISLVFWLFCIRLAFY